jgi:dienelactone hydrolase
MASRRLAPQLLAWLLVILTLAMMLLYPVAQNYLQAASLLTRIGNPDAKGWLPNYGVHAIDTRNETFDFQGSANPARIYMPLGVGPAPGIVVVHGMHELGIDEPRLVNFARALAASGFVVMTPQVEAIAEYRVEPQSADLIGAAAQTFAHELDVPKVGVLAISFSGGLSLLAAGDPQYSSSIAWVASIGGYYDLAQLLQFFATGDAVHPDGTVEHLAPHEYGPLIVVCDHPADFFPAEDVDKAREAIKLVLADEGKKSEEITKQMTPAGQEVMQRIYHKQLEGFRQALLAEVNKDREQLAAASPAGRVAFIHAPVFLLHGADDNVIPSTELLWLKEHVPPQYRMAALISPAITHVEVGHKSLRDQFALVHWLSLLLRQARNTPSSQMASLPVGTWLYAEAAQ